MSFISFPLLAYCRGSQQIDSRRKKKRQLSGVKVSDTESLTHLLFVVDILSFVQGTSRNFLALKNALDILCQAMGIEVNFLKSCVISSHLSKASSQLLSKALPFPHKELDSELKYLGFYLKPDKYKKEDWSWLLKKVEARISFWGNRLLSHGGRLTLIKSILESIHVFWTAIAVVPKGILSRIKSLSFCYLW